MPRAAPVEVDSTITIRTAASARKATPPDHRGYHEGVAELRVPPPVGEVTTLGGVRPDELHCEAVHQRPLGPKRSQADRPKDNGGHRTLQQNQPGIAGGQPETGTHGDAEEDQDPDDFHAAITGHSEGDPEGREDAAEDQGAHHAEAASRSQQRIRHQGSRDIEDGDLGQR
jgi:hypothetical protein